MKNREDTIIALLLDANQKIFQKIKEKIKPQDFKDETNRKIAEKYDADYDVIKLDVTDFVESMFRKNIIVEK